MIFAEFLDAFFRVLISLAGTVVLGFIVSVLVVLIGEKFKWW